MLEVRGIRKRYGRFEALHGIDLDLEAGTTALLGRNGAGKSTLVRILVGADRADSGTCELTIDGVTLTGAGIHRHVGWLPQAFGYPAGMRVEEYVRYAGWLKGLDRRDTQGAARDALRFADVQDSAHKRLEQLSGGTLRRVGLAVAIVHRPRLLVLDEPTAGLDPIQRANLHDRLATIAESTTVLLATHLLEDVDAVADRIEVIDEGAMCWSGSAAQLGTLSPEGVLGVDGLRLGLISIVGPAPA